MKQKLIKGDKQNSPKTILVRSLGVLNKISISPDVLEFCTPGHKAGRGFEAILSAEQVSLLLTLPEEVDHDV